jgi:PAS domain S-box-containing protein
MLSEPPRGVAPSWRWVAGALVAMAAIVAAEFASDFVLIGVLLVGPFIAALGARPSHVALLGVLAVGLAVVLGFVDDIFGNGDHVVRVGVVLVASAAAYLLARLRRAREEELASTLPAALDAQRFQLALEAGEMGTWHWNTRNGRVQWDARLEALCGLEPGAFGGNFSSYEAIVHPDDRARVISAVRDGMEHGHVWRFDHRVVWPDGSVHWLEGRGEPVRDADGAVIGATGIAIGVDARHQAATERASLLEGERRAREQAERSTRALEQLVDLTFALAGAITVEEVASTIVHHGMQALDADFGWFGSLDSATNRIITRAHEGYPEGSIADYLAIPASQRDLPASEALATGEAIYVESPDVRRQRYPHLDRTEEQGAFVVAPVAVLDDVPGVLSFGFRENRQFGVEERRYVGAVVEACTQALRRASLFEAEQASRTRLRTVLDFSEQLAGLDDPDGVLQTTARFAATRLGTFATVYVTEANGELRRAAVVHSDPARLRILQALHDRDIAPHETIAKVAQTGIGILFSGVADDPPETLQAPGLLDDEARALIRQLGQVSAVAVAMRVAGRTHGVIIAGDDRARPLGPTELELGTDLGRRSASALERAQLWRLSQLQLAAEQHMVQVLQESILPGQLPEVAGLDLAAVYRPADAIVDVGGDWYDAFAVPHSPLVVVVGDVAGHGIDAASLMGRARNGLRAYAVDDRDPGVLLHHVHELLRVHDPDSMVTAVVATYDPATMMLTWSRAGHPPPLLCDADGTTRFLEDVNATPLGTMGKNFASARVELSEGAVLVLYTDGLIERRERLIDEGLRWLAERTRALRHFPAQTICRSLVDRSADETPSADDICVVVLRVPPGVEAPARTGS